MQIFAIKVGRKGKLIKLWAVVVAQSVEWSLPIPEVRGSNPVIGKHLNRTFTVNCIEKTKIKEKEAGNGPFLKDMSSLGIGSIHLYEKLCSVHSDFKQWGPNRMGI